MGDSRIDRADRADALALAQLAAVTLRTLATLGILQRMVEEVPSLTQGEGEIHSSLLGVVDSFKEWSLSFVHKLEEMGYDSESFLGLGDRDEDAEDAQHS